MRHHFRRRVCTLLPYLPCGQRASSSWEKLQCERVDPIPSQHKRARMQSRTRCMFSRLFTIHPYIHTYAHRHTDTHTHSERRERESTHFTREARPPPLICASTRPACITSRTTSAPSTRVVVLSAVCGSTQGARSTVLSTSGRGVQPVVKYLGTAGVPTVRIHEYCC